MVTAGTRSKTQLALGFCSLLVPLVIGCGGCPSSDSGPGGALAHFGPDAPELGRGPLSLRLPLPAAYDTGLGADTGFSPPLQERGEGPAQILGASASCELQGEIHRWTFTAEVSGEVETLSLIFGDGEIVHDLDMALDGRCAESSFEASPVSGGFRCDDAMRWRVEASGPEGSSCMGLMEGSSPDCPSAPPTPYCGAKG
jgi:hypothetical protein